MFCAMEACTPRCVDSELVMPLREDSERHGRRPSFPASEEFLYPVADVRWFSGLERHPSFFEGIKPNGFEPPKVAAGRSQVRQRDCQQAQTSQATNRENKCGVSGSTETGGSSSSYCSSNDSTLIVALDRVRGLSPPHNAETAMLSYFATAFYQSEAQELRDARKTTACKASSCNSGAGGEDCVFDTTFSIPLNHREQFVKVAIYASAAKDELVGEASVPVADRRTSSSAVWPLFFGFDRAGEVILHLEFAAREPCVTSSTPGRHLEVCHSTASLGFKVGDAVEVFSKSAGKWLHSKVESLDDSCLTVTSGDLQRRINPKDKGLHEYVRIPSSSGHFDYL